MPATDFLVIYGFPEGGEAYCRPPLQRILQRALGPVELEIEGGVAVVPVESAEAAARVAAELAREPLEPLSLRLRCRHLSSAQAEALVAKMGAEEKNQLQEAGKALLRDHEERDLRLLLRTHFELALLFRAAIAE